MAERLKYNLYREFYGHSYFWRTVKQQEIDYLEDYDGRLHAYEFKWNPGKGGSLPKVFSAAYPNTAFQVIHRENYLGFLAPPAA